MAAKKRAQLSVGVMDHAGWAVLVTAQPDGTVVDRRRVELVEEGLPVMPHHHEGQRLPIDEAVNLVARVRASAARRAALELASLPPGVGAIALRALQPLPHSVAERITDYRAMCVADWVMYREVLAEAATARGWRVRWFDPETVIDAAATTLKHASLDALFAETKARLGKPWQQDHRLALAAAIASR